MNDYGPFFSVGDVSAKKNIKINLYSPLDSTVDSSVVLESFIDNQTMGGMANRFKGNKQGDKKVVPIQQQPVQVQYGPGFAQMPMRPALPPNQMPLGYGGGYPNAPPMRSGYPIQPSVPSYGNDMLLANVTGFSPMDIAHLRMEFYNYANTQGVIDRDGFRKLYIASLVNKTWDAINHEAEIAFRNFDVNRTGGLDFNEYMLACSRMLADTSHHQSMYPY